MPLGSAALIPKATEIADRENQNTASSNVMAITSGEGLNTIPPIIEQTNVIVRANNDRKKIFALAIDLAETGDENKPNTFAL